MSTIALGEPIARGRTAEVYAWGDGWVLKLFQEWVDRPSVEMEARITRAARSCGLPVPAVGEILVVDGRLGILSERVEGPTMGDAVKADLRLLKPCARRLAQLHAQMHSVPLEGEWLAQRSKLEWKIGHAAGLSDETRRAAIHALTEMPSGAQLCHGDWHPENVLMADQGEVMIDWMDASHGNALADVARTSVLLLGEAQRADYTPELRQLIGEFHGNYLDEYFRLRSQGREEYESWLPIVAAARLSEQIQEVRDWLVAIAQF